MTTKLTESERAALAEVSAGDAHSLAEKLSGFVRTLTPQEQRLMAVILREGLNAAGDTAGFSAVATQDGWRSLCEIAGPLGSTPGRD